MDLHDKKAHQDTEEGDSTHYDDDYKVKVWLAVVVGLFLLFATVKGA